MFNQSISPMSSFISVSPKNNTPSKKKRQQASKMQKCFSLGPPKNPTKKTLVQHLAQPKWTDSLSIHIHQILDQKNICIIHKICPSKRHVFRCHPTIHHPPSSPSSRARKISTAELEASRFYIEPRRLVHGPVFSV